MKPFILRAALLLGLAGATAGPALAFGGGGNSNSGSGLSPYASDTGNDRSAGVNNGNYQQPRFNTYRRAYGPRDAPYPRRGNPYGYPY